ncbi:DUF6531 domain-containing protein [Streptomyces hainanensis]|uniref:Rhs protein n=1 Tax=Streptomyces hainanensis TaxID=402648 RepID=A0A4R4TKJ5_9ACTN|nr:DUF6531 domain-containing protein [Streptomyces hainanensis]TDC76324.1 hypothetical protein E1283_10045 [Streptomyces hainanensis]
MVRPSDWSPVDMDSDPTPGNPDEVRELADELQTFADDVGEALGQVRGMSEDRAVLDWAGLSAEAFRSEFDGVPPNLQMLQTSYDMAAQALQTYWPKLETAQGMADRALDRAITAQADLSSAQSALTDAQDWVSRAGDEADRLEREGERDDVEPPSEADVRAATRDATAAGQAASDAQGQVDSAEEALSAARELARQAKEMREDAASTCASSIDEASDAGIQNRRWWEDAINWVSENWDTIVEICKVVVAVLGIVVLIIGGPLAWVVLAAALVVLADTLYDYANGEASLWDVAFAALDCIPGMKGLTTLGGLARGLRGGLSAARTGLTGLRQGVTGLGRNLRQRGVQMFRRNGCGDPVDVATGELLMSAVDVELPGVLPLVIERHHISTYHDGGWFGASWASTLDQRLVLDEYGARLFSADGMALLYPRPIPGDTVLPVEGPRWGLSWDGQPGSPITVHQRESGHTLHFVQVPGRPGGVLPLTAITDRNGNRIRVEYDPASGAPTDVIHDGGYHVGIGTENGRISELRLLNDPAQPVLLRYGYDKAGLLSEIYNSSGQPLRFAYDAHFRLTRWEDRNGYWYSYEYDDLGRCVFTTGTDRALEYRYHYQPETDRTIAVNSLGHSTIFQFNDSYQLIAQTDPLGHTTTHDWDRYDRTLALTDPLGHSTHYQYDDHGQIAAVTRPDGQTIRYEYNDLGLPTTVIDADGSVWAHAYDAAGNRTVVLDPAGNRTRYTHDRHGGLAAVTDPLGHTTTIRCDAAGLPVAVTSALGEVTHYDRDAFGRLVRVTDPLGAVSVTGYTVEGHPMRRVDPLGGAQSWVWDGEGNCVSHTDENGATTTFEYGAFDKLTTQIDVDGARYEFVRDTELQVVEVVNPHGLSWDYTYDEAGRLVGECDFDDRRVTYRLDAAGQLTARENALGQTVTFSHDVLGNLVTKSAGGTTWTFGYDTRGRVIEAAGGGSQVVIERDALGRVVSESLDGRKVTHTHDPMGRPLRRITPNRHESTWEYDQAGLPTVLVSAGKRFTFEHDAVGRETWRRAATGLALSQAWDPVGRLSEQTLTHAGDRTVRHRTFAYRADHHLLGVTDPTGGDTAHYSLDAIGRVTAATGVNGGERYTYDTAGNQTAAAWPGDLPGAGDRVRSGTRLTRAGLTRYEYDRAGRVVLRQRTRLSKKPDTWRYEWDAEDRLAAVTTPDGDRWCYHYDAFGRRIGKEHLDASGTAVERTGFVWAGTELVEQSTHASGREATTLTWDYNGLHPVAQTEGPAGDDLDRKFYAIVTDLVGTPTELVDEAGHVAWRRRATVWGAPLGSPASRTSDGATTTPLRFPGQYADSETGWHYNVHRHYDPETARYTGPDPLGLLPAPNHYGYVHNPHTWSDPLGLAAHPTGGRRRPEVVTETFADINQARNHALDLLGDINPHTRRPYRGRLESANTYGQVVGFETVVDGTWKRFRIDFDPGKGPHFNVEVGRGPDAERFAVPWEGTEQDMLNALSRLNR